MSHTVKYDTREAHHLLSVAGSQSDDARRMRNAELPQLLNELVALSAPGVVIRRHPTAIHDGTLQVFVNGGAAVTIALDYSAGCLIITREAVKRQISLVYNTHTKRLEGAEVDQHIVPTPGEPLPRRSAIAVVVEAALAVADGDPHS